mgnify:CR=1 FL=1
MYNYPNHVAIGGYASGFGNKNWKNYSKIVKPARKIADVGLIIQLSVGVDVDKRNFDINNPENKEELIDGINSTLYHELNHCYEHYKRTIKGSKRGEYRKPIYDRSFNTALTYAENNKWKFPKAIWYKWTSEFLTYIYFSERQEMNANIQEINYFIDKYPNKDLKEFKIYRIANEMKYFNADGNVGSMCGNGGRCITLYAFHAGIKKSSYHFLASDGPHESIIRTNGTIALKMKDVHEVRKHKEDFILNTGSPHLIRFVRNLQEEDMVAKGRAIRFSKEFEAEGINVNFIELEKDEQSVQIRTYERGVENETLSCGTGATAAALICYHNENGFNDVHVKTKGGMLQIEYDRVGDQQFQNIWLCGPAEKVFETNLDFQLFK